MWWLTLAVYAYLHAALKIEVMLNAKDIKRVPVGYSHVGTGVVVVLPLAILYSTLYFVMRQHRKDYRPPFIAYDEFKRMEKEEIEQLKIDAAQVFTPFSPGLDSNDAASSISVTTDESHTDSTGVREARARSSHAPDDESHRAEAHLAKVRRCPRCPALWL